MHSEWLTFMDKTLLEGHLDNVDLVIGVSKYVTDKIRERFPQFAKRCQTVYPGVNIEAFRSSGERLRVKGDNTKKVLFVGRVSPEKGVHVLLDAFQRVIKQCPQTRLQITGPFDPLPIEREVGLSNDPKVAQLVRFYKNNARGYITHLQRMISGMSDHVLLTGPFARQQVIDSYQADLFVFPSLWKESFGIPIVEAMAAGIPVVGTRAGGVPEIVVDGKTGMLVERGDASALGEAIVYLLQNDNARKSMGEAGRERAARLFSWEHSVEDLLRQYDAILASA
jgi:glycosyltransferase involved in cell wall biosynthesis